MLNQLIFEILPGFTNMEVEPASRTEFEDDIIKHQENIIKNEAEINEINGNKDTEIDVKQISDTIKEIVNDGVDKDDEDKKEDEREEEDKPEAAVNETVTSNGDINTSAISNENDTSEDANDKLSDIKPKDETIKEDVEMEDDSVKDEPMDHDGDADHELDNEPDQPPEEDQDRSVKLEDPLFEELIIDGFSFSAFDKYTVLEVSLC